MTREGMMRLVALCVFLVAACGYDYKERRIPNYLILWVAITGVGWRLWNERAPGLPGDKPSAAKAGVVIVPMTVSRDRNRAKNLLVIFFK